MQFNSYVYFRNERHNFYLVVNIYDTIKAEILAVSVEKSVSSCIKFLKPGPEGCLTVSLKSPMPHCDVVIQAKEVFNKLFICIL